MTPDEIAAKIPKYEGLIFKTATMIEQHVEFDLEDIRQRLRIKVWRALVSYNPVRAKQELDGYVFSCVVNEKKDILKTVRRGDVYIEEFAPASRRDRRGKEATSLRDRFEARYLCEAEENAYADVEREPPLLPDTLTALERQIIGLLYEGWMQTEVRKELALSTWAFYGLMSSIKGKMADWRPAKSERAPGPTPPLPPVLPSQADEPSPVALPPHGAARAGVPTRERAAVS